MGLFLLDRLELEALFCAKEASLLRLEGPTLFERSPCVVNALLVEGPTLETLLPVLLLNRSLKLEMSFFVVPTLLLEEEAV